MVAREGIQPGSLARGLIGTRRGDAKFVCGRDGHKRGWKLGEHHARAPHRDGGAGLSRERGDERQGGERTAKKARRNVGVWLTTDSCGCAHLALLALRIACQNDAARTGVSARFAATLVATHAATFTTILVAIRSVKLATA